MLEVGRIDEEEIHQSEKKKAWTPKFEMEDIEDMARMTEEGMLCMQCS